MRVRGDQEAALAAEAIACFALRVEAFLREALRDEAVVRDASLLARHVEVSMARARRLGVVTELGVAQFACLALDARFRPEETDELTPPPDAGTTPDDALRTLVERALARAERGGGA